MYRVLWEMLRGKRFSDLGSGKSKQKAKEELGRQGGACVGAHTCVVVIMLQTETAHASRCGSQHFVQDFPIF